ncbi:MAG TPA: hypothetical protein VFN25_12160 [Dokdonella sp.]|uniref:sulfotransferase-like domain-containing protein n=1 Tax=Dokdonella sp. TaxID=2291710 RepID=UPI002D7EA979|nr:hypothetical protein [Dokdonella sp.]HET9033644.1 hypothetical protein [Dokdonella sp.]
MSGEYGPLRIAMWSGPRNLSTAMMRSWENRGDCFVSDEPFYAHYLAETGFVHPVRDEVIADGETDWKNVAATMVGEIPDGQPIWYQKHMCQHMLAHIDHDWMSGLAHAFLIRDPAQVVASYLRSRDTVSAEEIGLPQEVRLFDEVCDRLGSVPPVIDADDFLVDPEAHLRALCAHFDIPFRESMLHWPAGPRDSDGIWAPHWYAAVWNSTGFESPRPRDIKLNGEGARVAEECRPLYEKLYRHRLQV